MCFYGPKLVDPFLSSIVFPFLSFLPIIPSLTYLAFVLDLSYSSFFLTRLNHVVRAELLVLLVAAVKLPLQLLKPHHLFCIVL